MEFLIVAIVIILIVLSQRPDYYDEYEPPTIKQIRDSNPKLHEEEIQYIIEYYESYYEQPLKEE